MEMERTTITRLRVSSFIREFGGWEGADVEGGALEKKKKKMEGWFQRPNTVVL